MRTETKRLVRLWKEIKQIDGQNYQFKISEYWNYSDDPYWTVECTNEYSIHAVFTTYDEALKYLHGKLSNLIEKEHTRATEVLEILKEE